MVLEAATGPTWTASLPYLLAAVGTMVAAMAGGYAVYRKLPAEKRDITITSADRLNQMTLRFSEAVDEDNVSLREQIAELRVQIATQRRDDEAYRKKVEERLAELADEVRTEREQKIQVKAENEQLKLRVTELETEVAALKSRTSPPTTTTTTHSTTTTKAIDDPDDTDDGEPG